MPRVTYDADVFIRPKPQRFPSGFYMSAVVLQEITAGATDGSALRELDAARRNYEKGGRLLTPTGEDWYEAGKVIYALQRGRKSQKTGEIQPLPAEVRCRLLNDVLIARTAKRAGVAVVSARIAGSRGRVPPRRMSRLGRGAPPTAGSAGRWDLVPPASAEPGDLFVVRNPGNIVSPAAPDGLSVADESEAAAIEFAVGQLQVRDIIVCGHSSCGAMGALTRTPTGSRPFSVCVRS